MYVVGEYAKEVKNGAIYPPPPPVYFSTHPVSQPRLGHSMPMFIPAHRDLPPKYEEVIREAPPPPPYAVGPVQSPVQQSEQQQDHQSQQPTGSQQNDPLPPV